MWRFHRDESHFTDAQKFAWNLVLPYMNIPILETDTIEAAKYEKALKPLFNKINNANKLLQEAQRSKLKGQKLQEAVAQAIRLLESTKPN